MRLLPLAMLVSVLGTPSCGVVDAISEVCTEIGCQDGAALSIRTPDGTWPDGAYTLTLTVAGTTHTCDLTLPEDLPARGSVGEVPCEPTLGFQGVSFSQDARCTEQRSGNAVSQSCTPIADHFTLEAFLQATPNEVMVTLARDGETLLEQTVALSYTENRPNGADCEPICRNASADLTLQ